MGRRLNLKVKLILIFKKYFSTGTEILTQDCTDQTAGKTRPTFTCSTYYKRNKTEVNIPKQAMTNRYEIHL